MQAAVSGILGSMSGSICFVVGARPNFMKVAPVFRALDAHDVRALRAGGRRSGMEQRQRGKRVDETA